MSIIQRIQDTYDRLDARSVRSGLLGELYDDQIVFIDPLHRIEGLTELERYFEGLYRNVTAIEFQYQNAFEGEGEAILRWEMTLRHPRLDGGNPILLPGVTYLRHGDRIHWHQDYFDSNRMIFDHLPVIGSVLGWLKGRLNQ